MNTSILRTIGAPVLVALLLICGAYAVSPMTAEALDENQIQAIVLLLNSFGANPSTVANVEATLRGQSGGGSGQVFCTADAKLCPDGSYVGRVAPSCNFAPCPGEGGGNTGGTGSVTGGGLFLPGQLNPGDRSPYVQQLQQFLARDRSIYPEGLTTGFYGSLTIAAVQRFQARCGIVSSGSPDSTGYGRVGPSTLRALSNGCSGVPGGSTGTPSQVGGLVRVTPVSGTAPLTVTATASVNTARSCEGAAYQLNFGDGTASVPIYVSPGNCQEITQNISHTYTQAGTYTVTLGIGVHQTTVTVTVRSSSNSSQDDLSASPTSGNAPLSVAFSARINSNLSCSASNYTLAFGDGTSMQQLPVQANLCSQALHSVSHTYNQTGTYIAGLYRGTPGEVSAGTATLVDSTSISVGGSSTGNLSLSLSPSSLAIGAPLQISWNAPNAPSGSKVRLEVWRANTTPASGNNDNGLAAGTSELSTSGSYVWTVSDRQGTLADAGHSGLVITPGTYKIVAKLYSGGTCWGFCAGNTSRTIHATTEQTFTFTQGSTTNQGDFTVAAGINGNPRTIQATFDLNDSICTSYSISWGDGSSAETYDAGNNATCSGSAAEIQATKTYSSAGTYTIRLKRGNQSLSSITNEESLTVVIVGN